MGGLAAGQTAVGGEDAPHAEQRQGDHQEAGDGATAHGHAHRADEAGAGRGRGAQVGLDADEHADDAGGHGARGADQEGDGRADAQRQAADAGVGDVRSLDDGDDGADHQRAEEREDADGRVLATDEGDRALVDGGGHVLHGLRALVLGNHPARQVQREEDGECTRDGDDQVDRVGHGVVSLP